jgi:GT2 family glycosyltransferase
MAPLFRNTSHAVEVAVISGACVMVKRAVFEQAGQFSPEYFMYAEDVDLCYKIKTLGYRNYYIPDVSVVHFGGGSSNQAPSSFSIRMKRESMWRFLVKTRGASYGLAYRLSMIVSSVFRLALLLPSIYMKKSSLTESDPTQALHKWSVIFKWGVKIRD